MLKKNLSCVLWLSLLNLPLALYSAVSYAPPIANSPWFVLGTFTCAAVGHFFLYFFLVSLVFIFPFLGFGKKGVSPWRYLYGALIIALAQIVLAADAQVFTLYRFHLSIAMLDLFINGGGEVISLSSDTWWSIILQASLIVLYSLVVFAAALFLSRHLKARYLALLAIVMYVLANLIHAYATARQVLPLMELQTRLPLYRPLTMNSLLMKLGVISAEDLSNRQVKVQEGIFEYPKTALSYAPVMTSGSGGKVVSLTESASPEEVAGTAPYNVLILTIDALRADMITPEIMPYTNDFAQSSWRYLNHYSASNSTRGGIFGLFYGLPPSYWNIARTSGVASIITQVVENSDYQYGIFASANLYRPEFNATVFAGVPNLRVKSDVEGDVLARDQDALNDFTTFINDLEPNQPFFSFIFLDNVHAYSSPAGMEKRFSPAATSINHMELKADSDPLPILNLYKNAAYYADQNVQYVLTLLSDHGLLDHTIVIITSDHGEEINEDGDNFWGHNSNFKDLQIKIPFIMKWPGQEPRVINALTSAYDVSATLVPRVFGVTNPRSDYTIGYDLFNPAPRDYVLAGSYLESAVVEKDRIVLIDELGMLRFKDKNYQESTNTTRDHNLFDALKKMSYYLQGVPRIAPEPTPKAASTSSATADAAAAAAASDDAAAPSTIEEAAASSSEAPAPILEAQSVERAGSGIALLPATDAASAGASAPASAAAAEATDPAVLSAP